MQATTATFLNVTPEVSVVSLLLGKLHANLLDAPLGRQCQISFGKGGGVFGIGGFELGCNRHNGDYLKAEGYYRVQGTLGTRVKIYKAVMSSPQTCS